jgi:hypothetical protein
MPQPNLGYGKPTEASIDTVNQWMRSQPWYQQKLQQWGQNPNNTHLSKEQSQDLLRTAQSQGVVVDEGNMEVDPSGNFNPKGHKLRNTLIVAGIAGASIATMGAAGMFAGAGGAASGAAGAGAGAGAAVGGGAAAGGSVLGSTAIGTGMMAPIAGGTGMAGGGSLLSTLGTFAMNHGSDIADVLGGMSKSQRDTNAGRDSLQVLLERAKLDRDKYALTAPGTRMDTSMRASMANNFTPTKVDWGEGGFKPGMGARGIIPRITGGAGGALANLDPATRALNRQVMDDELTSQQRGGSSGGGYDSEMPTLSQNSRLDKVVGGGSSILSLLSAFKNRRTPRASVMPTRSPMPVDGEDM